MKTIFLGSMCNNDCVMCSIKNVSGLDFTADKQEVMAEIKKGSAPNEILEFTGGEVTKHENIIDFFKKANELDYKSLKMSTNGRKFADSEFTKKLVDYGLKRVDLAIHGDEKIHDQITQKKGAFKEAVQGVKNLQKEGVKITVASVLIKQNIDNLSLLYEKLIDWGIEEVGILELVPDGRAQESFQEFAVSHKERKQFLYKNKKIFSNFKFTRVVNFTRCTLPINLPKNWEHISLYKKQFLDYDYGKASKTDPTELVENKEKTKFCNRCKLKNVCCGFSRKDLNLFGEKGVKEMMEFDGIDKFLISSLD